MDYQMITLNLLFHWRKEEPNSLFSVCSAFQKSEFRRPCYQSSIIKAQSYVLTHAQLLHTNLTAHNRMCFSSPFFHGHRPMENKWWWGTRSPAAFELTSWSLKKFQKAYRCWLQQCWFVHSGFGKRGPELQSQASEIFTRHIIPATFFSAFIWQGLSLVGCY